MEKNDVKCKDKDKSVPCNKSLVKMDEKLNMLTSVHGENLCGFRMLRDEIRSLLNFYTGSVMMGQCQEIKKHYLDQENKNINIFKRSNLEYNLIDNEVSEVSEQIKELEKNIAEVDALQEELCDVTKKYQLHKISLNVAKKCYEQSFGLEIVTEDEGNSEFFTAFVSFNAKQDFPIKFRINRRTSVITDMEVSSFKTENLENLKEQFLTVNNLPGLLGGLRNMIVNDRD